jgi:D-beta-D-heptose 7-phosphate kinase/D-beta-D-heptose 1-phosphate adenosyltransferase
MGTPMRDYDFNSASVLVLGDIMLDRYYFGHVYRISPEAPVPVVQVTDTRESPGGAANVARNISFLKARATLMGMVGDDDNRKVLEKLLKELGIHYDFYESSFSTITKIRVIGEHQQIVRIDFEEENRIGSESLDIIKEKINRLAEGVNYIVISDYGKGFCSPEVCEYIIKTGQEKDLRVIVDPKGKNWSKYRKAFIITPNIKELSEVSGIDVQNKDGEIERYGLKVLRKYELQNLLVTRSDRGMSLVSRDAVVHIPTEAKEVYDVSGAGDTVVGTLAAALSSGMELVDSVGLANKAAGIVVSKIGTAPIRIEELNGSLQMGESNRP